VSKIAHLEEAKREAARFFADADKLQVKEREAVMSKRKMEYQLKTANTKNAHLEKEAHLHGLDNVRPTESHSTIRVPG
jgi:hypothetical protein